MGARFADVLEIAGIEYPECRANLVNHRALFDSIRAGSIYYGGGNVPSVQVSSRAGGGVAGIPFGLSLYSAQFDQLDDTITAINVAEAAMSPFPFIIQDGRYNLSLLVFKDYNQEQWYTADQYSEEYEETLLFRFVAHSVYIP